MAPRPDLNGLRVQQYGDPSVYLMDQGLRRLIPTQQVMARLFTLGANWVHRYDAAAPGVILDLHVSQMDSGLPLPEECVIFQTTDSPQVFLLDHDANGEQVKRWITTAEAMDRFQFDWAKIKRWDVPLAGLGLPDGPDISWP
jgi:hypothetical protein